MTNIKIRHFILNQNKSSLRPTTGTWEIEVSACFSESYVLQLDSQVAAVNRQTE